MDTVFMLGAMVVIGLLVWAMFALGVPPTPTLPHIRKAVIGMLPKNAKSIGELGGGWGGMSNAFAAALPEARVTAYEQSFLPYWISKWRARGKNITVLQEDFFSADLTQFDTLYCYLSPKHMVRLKPLIPSGMTVISNAFPIPGWQPLETQTLGRRPAIVVFRYKAP